MTKLIERLSSLSVKQKLVVIVILGLFLKLLTYWAHPTLHRDSVLYLSINQYAQEGDVDSGLALYPECPPAIYYSLRFVSLFGNAEIGYRFLSILLYSLTVIPFYHIAFNLTNSQRASLFGALAISIHPKIIDYSHCVLRESISFPFLIFGLFFLVLAYKENIYWSIAAGIVLCNNLYGQN